MSTYFSLRCPLTSESAVLTDEPYLSPPLDNWMGGNRLEAPVPEPLTYEIESDGKQLMSFYNTLVPLMSAELLSALASAGVENLELFDATVSDLETGTTYDGYKAVNIVGVVAAADMQQSDSANLGLDDSGLIDTFFRNLVVDESRIPDVLMFRLAESVKHIIVHESVREAVEAAGLTDLQFTSHDPA